MRTRQIPTFTDLKARLWDYKNKNMIYIKDLCQFADYGIHESGDGGFNGSITDNIMIASPFVDKRGNRLYEKDLVRLLVPDYPGIDRDIVEVCYTDSGWDFMWVHRLGSGSMHEWLAEKGACVKVGNIYSEPWMIRRFMDELKEKELAEIKERELKELSELMARYGNPVDNENAQ